jgi:hypothetical protein
MTVRPSGLLTIDSATYHADQIDDTRPSLSKSIIATILDKSPAHARIAHPRLNPNFEREAEKKRKKDGDKFDFGTAAHALFLEGDAGVEVYRGINPKTGEFVTDWKTGLAQEAKALARQYGRIPMLAHQYDECVAMVAALRAQCDPAGLFTEGTPEQTIVWTDEYDVLCRARLDWLIYDEEHPERAAVHDLKTTKASAHRDDWSRTALSIGADLQYAFYLRGCRAVFGVEPEFTFVVAETYPPYAMQPFGVAPDTLALAEKRISYALKTWAMCLRNDAWPSYPTQVAHITTPPYIEAAWLEKELREVEAA